MKLIALSTMLILLSCCRPSGSNSQGSPSPSASPILLDGGFQRYGSSQNITPFSYSPLVTWVRKTPISAREAQSGRDIVIVFNDDFASDIQLGAAWGSSVTDSGFVRIEDTETKVEKQGPHTWRLVFSSDFLKRLANHRQGADTNIRVPYRIGETEFSRVFPNMLGLKAKPIETKNGYVTVGQLILPLESELSGKFTEALHWDEKRKNDEQLFASRYVNHADPRLGRTEVSAKSVRGAGNASAKSRLTANIFIPAPGKCELKLEFSQDGAPTATQNLNSACELMDGYLILPGAGTLAIRDGSELKLNPALLSNSTGLTEPTGEILLSTNLVIRAGNF